LNQLEDPDIIEALCRASQAGVSIDLIIRGFCCLRPGAPGVTENIRVRSITGRFLEHSRVFHFANGKEEPLEGDYFIGSADWMVRNLSKRVEVVTPIFEREHKAKLQEFLGVCLKDRRQAWVLGSDGAYTQLTPESDSEEEAEGTHQVMMNRMRARAGA
jgi:polyphosphate kinase